MFRLLLVLLTRIQISVLEKQAAPSLSDGSSESQRRFIINPLSWINFGKVKNSFDLPVTEEQTRDSKATQMSAAERKTTKSPFYMTRSHVRRILWCWRTLLLGNTDATEAGGVQVGNVTQETQKIWRLREKTRLMGKPTVSSVILYKRLKLQHINQ